MKRFILGICVLVCVLAATSFGQNKADDWKGLYVGANVGGAFGGADARTTVVAPAGGYFVDTDVTDIAGAGNQHIDLNGFTGGVQLGYNATAGKTFLIGGEFDFGALDTEQSKAVTMAYTATPGFNFTVQQKVSAGWLMTVRPRIGITHKKALIYGTGGLALSEIHDRVLFIDNFANALAGGGQNETKAGWTVGGGIEYKAAEHWSFKGEYLYVNFGRVSSTSNNLIATFLGDPTPTSFPTNVFTHSTDLHANIIRVGLNYHF